MERGCSFTSTARIDRWTPREGAIAEDATIEIVRDKNGDAICPEFEEIFFFLQEFEDIPFWNLLDLIGVQVGHGEEPNGRATAGGALRFSRARPTARRR